MRGEGGAHVSEAVCGRRGNGDTGGSEEGESSAVRGDADADKARACSHLARQGSDSTGDESQGTGPKGRRKKAEYLDCLVQGQPSGGISSVSPDYLSHVTMPHLCCAELH